MDGKYNSIIITDDLTFYDTMNNTWPSLLTPEIKQQLNEYRVFFGEYVRTVVLQANENVDEALINVNPDPNSYNTGGCNDYAYVEFIDDSDYGMYMYIYVYYLILNALLLRFV